MFYPLLVYFNNFFEIVIFEPVTKVNKKGKQFFENVVFYPQQGEKKPPHFGAAVVVFMLSDSAA